MTPDSFNSLTVTVTPQSVLWKYNNASVYFRSADGSCNNIKNPRWGMAGTAEIRDLEMVAYGEFHKYILNVSEKLPVNHIHLT